MDYLNRNYSEIDNIKLNTTGIHYTMLCSHDLCMKYAPLAADVLDDPKAGSCYTNYAITELASKFCTVLYSGAGGDEVFKGYTHRYDKPVSVVAKRGMGAAHMVDLTHEQYDWKYLQGILVVEDRMAGNFAMETRYPFLDNDLVNYVATLPLDYLMGKCLLKDICGLDHNVVTGKKKGFSNPHFSNTMWSAYLIEHLTQKNATI
jgi:asparagine synthetase B (glutamine-hydrolysing)